jgi:hypothetical protein
MRPVTVNPRDPVSALREIERASHENDVLEIAQNFTVDNPAFAHALQVNTAAPTAANCAAVLATLLTIIQKGGLNRTT